MKITILFTNYLSTCESRSITKFDFLRPQYYSGNIALDVVVENMRKHYETHHLHYFTPFYTEKPLLFNVTLFVFCLHFLLEMQTLNVKSGIKIVKKLNNTYISNYLYYILLSNSLPKVGQVHPP